jgi:threonine synthase
MPGLIERYRESLPFAPEDPVVSLGEGSTPHVLAERLSERAGAEVWLKIEGANPTGSFKDRGMTCAVSAAVREGAEALELVRELAKRRPIALVNSVNPFRLEGQKTASFEILDELGEIDALCIPVGNAGNVTAYWKGFQERGSRPRMLGYQAAGAAPLVHGAPVEAPETIASAIRIGNPARWEEALDAFTSSRGQVRAVTDAQILDAYRFLAREEGVFCEPASAAGVAGLLANGAEGAERIACVLTGHGLKDPQTALAHAGSVVPCEPDIAAVERAIDA